jgi:hypothetical protein
MKAVETRSVVGPDHEATIRVKLPPEVKPGEHRFIVITDEDSAVPPGAAGDVDDLITWVWEGWPAGCTFRREDLYGNDGRYAGFISLCPAVKAR